MIGPQWRFCFQCKRYFLGNAFTTCPKCGRLAQSVSAPPSGIRVAKAEEEMGG